MSRKTSLAEILAVAFSSVYLLFVVAPFFFNESQPFFGFMEDVDLRLPLIWFFSLAKFLGLSQPLVCHGSCLSTPSFFGTWVFVSVGSSLYAVIGYVIGAVISALLNEIDYGRGED